MATDNAAPGMMTLDRTDGSATLELYRAAIGQVHTAYYLKAFTRFDAAGKPGMSWNWTAALLSFNWLLFRQLWAWALAYVGAVTGTLLLLFGIGRLLFQLSDTSQWVLLALAVLLSFLVPGAYGNAWLYAACNKKMEAALVPAAGLEEACAWLMQRAPGRKQQGILAAGNLALLALVGGTVLSWPNSHELPLQTAKMEQARSAPAADLQSGLAAQNVATAASASASASASALASAPMALASAPATPAPAPAIAALATPLATPPQAATSAVATRTSQGLVQAEPSPTAAAPARPSASTPALSAARAASAPAAAASSALATAAPVAESTKPLPAKLTKAERRAKAQQEQKEKLATAKEAKALKAAAAKGLTQEKSRAPASGPSTVSATVAAPSPASVPAPAADKFLINVGLFADANNARNAYAKLKDAGLPALSQEIKSAKGVRIRVRVGPYDSQSEADSAAETIRALHLDAAVVKP